MNIKIIMSSLLLMLLINGCGINDRTVDPGLENDAGRLFQAHDHQRGEGFGLWNQQRDPKNPVARIVTRDERPGRGMNGILDRTPPEMNERRSRFAAQSEPSTMLEGSIDDNEREQIRLQLLDLDVVRDVRIISQQNHLLIAVDIEASNEEELKNQITSYVLSKYPTQQITVVTDRRAVDRIRLLDDGFRQTNIEDLLEHSHGPIVGQ